MFRKQANVMYCFESKHMQSIVLGTFITIARVIVNAADVAHLQSLSKTYMLPEGKKRSMTRSFNFSIKASKNGQKQR